MLGDSLKERREKGGERRDATLMRVERQVAGGGEDGRGGSDGFYCRNDINTL